jgi:uncharacterized protein YkwD
MELDYPPPPVVENQDKLVNYALALINYDRKQNRVENVTLSKINSVQMHAEDMLNKGYFSHSDTQGNKPYMRYTFAGGIGTVTENICWSYNSMSINVGEAPRNLEYNMMYNDSEQTGVIEKIY